MTSPVFAPDAADDWELVEWHRPDRGWIARGELLCTLINSRGAATIPAGRPGWLQIRPGCDERGRRLNPRSVLGAICEANMPPDWTEIDSLPPPAFVRPEADWKAPRDHNP